MQIHHFDRETGRYIASSIADEHPLKAGEFIMPDAATTEAPPAEQDGFYRAFIDGEWVQVEIPVPPEPPVDVNGNIRNAPEGLFGGPTIGELFHGN